MAKPSLTADQRAAIAARKAEPRTIADLNAALDLCRACPLWKNATQGVGGEGGARASVMLVGEQPGDKEDLAGRPFVGPAGRVLDDALEEAGVARREAFITNAVKHFKNEPRGKRRLHKRPNAGEVQACKWWLDREVKLVRPKVIVALGATAMLSLAKYRGAIGAVRGKAMAGPEGATLMATVHPSSLLREPDAAARREKIKAFVADLKTARGVLGA
jgi:DNA polymerase